LCFVLDLLLIRRKLLKEEPHVGDSHENFWVLKCPTNDATYELTVQNITSSQAAQLQEELVQLIYGGIIPDVPELELPEDEAEA
jgi:hypothetical protein